MKKVNKQYSMFKIQCAVFSLLLLACLPALAQKDTLKKGTTIDITSSYKPVLRNAVKINFSASHLNADTSKPKMFYTVPAQNLFYAYQPVSLKPLALQQDTNLNLGMRNYLKAGFGNFSTPYVAAGFSFGDGKKSLLNLYADYIASKGKIKYQDYAQMNLKASGSYFSAKNEAYGSVGFSQHDTYLYGYDHAIYNYKKDSIRNQYQDVNLKAGIRNTVIGEFGIKYNPNVTVNNYTLKNKVSESSLTVSAPIEKWFGEAMSIKVEARADITTYSTKNLTSNVKLNNNVLQVLPSLAFASPQFTVNAGITPTWDNGNFVWLPNVYAEAQLKEKVFMVQAGWVGNYTKNTFRNLSIINPYLLPVTFQKNTKETEIYGGIKATMGKHFNFSAKAGFITYSDLPLFINDTATDGKAFKTVYEAKANNLRIHGDLSFISQDKFTVTTGLTLNGYTGFVNKAWNTVPMELNASLRWWAFKQVLLKSDFYAFGGGNYIDKGNVAKTFKGGTDLSAGMEFKVNKTFSAWLDVNNILNNKYQRWHNYEVYGLNVLGGVRITF
jgi:hypothetical protein